MKKSVNLGMSISKAEVLNLDPMGIWLLVGEKEYFLNHEQYPWFLKAKIEDIFNVSLVSEKHLRWENLDIDLDVNSIEILEVTPLIYKP